ncbi:mitochondrial import inner membrane translocase [Diplogelasinospora grovesii]|uniref:Mitochondrial import inner membrane translocase subunit TIM50 n=1 Tax=Diplogelasinospora grovesii TaxID=303347 RepID=A0AAN6MZF6_9PEZI|nr:mitochondrial import inner membrane translocase [Diplogelasinospora grovesii]
MMLSRAAARSAAGVRAAALAKSPALAQRTLPAIWMRGMAKDSKSQPSRFRRPQTSASSKTSQPPASDSSNTRSSDGPTDSATKSATDPSLRNEQTPPPEGSESQEPIPDLSKLPDLTQGIPSTLEYETTGATNRSSLAAVDEGSAAGGGGRGKGELPASAYVSSAERRRQKLANWMFALTGLSLVGGTVYLGRDWDEEELAKHPEVPNGWGFGLWWNRAMARLGETMTYYQEPAFEKLLPDPDPTFARPYTLCISLEDMLVHSEWTREHGWRLAKRPGMDYFLRYLSQYYELVLFTTVPFATGEPLVRKLDPYRFIMWPLYREATKYKDGEIVKDLSYLNRDLSKVIIIDTHAQHVRAQPENAIILPKWTGDPKDDELVALIPFLEYIHTMQYGDVRKVLKSFEGKHIPTEFARREAIARAEFNKQLEAQRGKASRSSGGGGMSWLSNHLGLKPSNMSLMVTEGEENPVEAMAKGKMLQDIARERGMRNYLMLEEEIRKNGATWLKEEAELQEKAQKEAMKSMQSSFTSWFAKPTEEPKNDASTTPMKEA